MSDNKRCLSCRHYGNHFSNLSGQTPAESFDLGWCSAPAVAAQVESLGYIVARGSNVDITTAREICDRELDGVFVYFEPLIPAAGAVSEPPTSAGGQFAKPSLKRAICSDSLCEYSEEFAPDELGINYFQSVGKCPFCSADTVYDDGTPTRMVVVFKAAA